MARRKAERFPSWATVMEYVDSILEGRKIACPELVQACRRFKQDLENPAWDFNPRDAEFVIRIIETTFVHQQGERLDGTPLPGAAVPAGAIPQVHCVQPAGILSGGDQGAAVQGGPDLYPPEKYQDVVCCGRWPGAWRC